MVIREIMDSLNTGTVIAAGTPLKPEHIAAVTATLGWERAKNTQATYRASLADFESWLSSHGYAAGPATVCAYLVALDEAGAATSTLRVRLAAIASVYPGARRNPLVEERMKAIVRRRAAGQSTRGNRGEANDALPLTALKTMCDYEPHTKAEIRDRAMLLLGFWGGFRRSELVALKWSDLQFVEKGIVVNISKSKTDQEGAGASKPVAAQRDKSICPAAALLRWREACGRAEYVFVGTVYQTDRVTQKRLTPQVVDMMVKREARRAGVTGEYSAHSLRSGFVTLMRRNRVADQHTKRVTGHKTQKMLDHYDQSPVEDAMDAVAAALE